MLCRILGISGFSSSRRPTNSRIVGSFDSPWSIYCMEFYFQRGLGARVLDMVMVGPAWDLGLG
jgi:hypothetical protein